jgi:GH43 family beta-xylosidase
VNFFVYRSIKLASDVLRYYIYVAIDDGNNANHRMYVLEGDTNDPLLPFTFVGKLNTPDDNWAIDGTVLKDVCSSNCMESSHA